MNQNKSPKSKSSQAAKRGKSDKKVDVAPKVATPTDPIAAVLSSPNVKLNQVQVNPQIPIAEPSLQVSRFNPKRIMEIVADLERRVLELEKK